MKRTLWSLVLIGLASSTAHAMTCEVAEVCVRTKCTLETVCWEDPVADPPQPVNIPPNDSATGSKFGVKITENGHWVIVSLDRKSVTTDDSLDCNSEEDLLAVAAGRAEAWGDLPLGWKVVLHVPDGKQTFVKTNDMASGLVRWTPTTECGRPDHSGNN